MSPEPFLINCSIFPAKLIYFLYSGFFFLSNEYDESLLLYICISPLGISLLLFLYRLDSPAFSYSLHLSISYYFHQYIWFLAHQHPILIIAELLVAKTNGYFQFLSYLVFVKLDSFDLFLDFRTLFLS